MERLRRPLFFKSPSHLRECYSMRSNQCVRQWSVHFYIYIYIFLFFVVDRFKTFISLQIPFKHLLWIPPLAVIASRASEGKHCLIITCHWLGEGGESSSTWKSCAYGTARLRLVPIHARLPRARSEPVLAERYSLAASTWKS